MKKQEFKERAFYGHAPRIFVKVTGDKIREGIRANSSHCMIADSIKESHSHLTRISVDIATIRATDRKKRERYVWLTPRCAQKHVVQWDLGSPDIKPFAFYLRDGQVTACGGHRATVSDKRNTKRKLRQSTGGNKHTVPERVGGRTPPLAMGQRRQYGLRSFDLAR